MGQSQSTEEGIQSSDALKAAMTAKATAALLKHAGVNSNIIQGLGPAASLAADAICKVDDMRVECHKYCESVGRTRAASMYNALDLVTRLTRETEKTIVDVYLMCKRRRHVLREARDACETLADLKKTPCSSEEREARVKQLAAQLHADVVEHEFARDFNKNLDDAITKIIYETAGIVAILRVEIQKIAEDVKNLKRKRDLMILAAICGSLIAAACIACPIFLGVGAVAFTSASVAGVTSSATCGVSALFVATSAVGAIVVGCAATAAAATAARIGTLTDALEAMGMQAAVLRDSSAAMEHPLSTLQIHLRVFDDQCKLVASGAEVVDKPTMTMTTVKENVNEALALVEVLVEQSNTMKIAIANTNYHLAATKAAAGRVAASA